MSNYNDGLQPPTGEPPKQRPSSAWQPGQLGSQSQVGQPGSPWQTGQPQPGSPWQTGASQPIPPNPAWQGQTPDQQNPWQTPPEPRPPYVPDIPPGGGANSWAYERPQPPYGPDTAPLTTKDYFINILLFTIPCAGWIIALVFAFSSAGPQARKNLARGYLLVMLFWMGVSIVLWILTLAAGMSLFNSFNGYY